MIMCVAHTHLLGELSNMPCPLYSLNALLSRNHNIFFFFVVNEGGWKWKKERPLDGKTHKKIIK